MKIGKEETADFTDYENKKQTTEVAGKDLKDKEKGSIVYTSFYAI